MLDLTFKCYTGETMDYRILLTALALVSATGQCASKTGLQLLSTTELPDISGDLDHLAIDTDQQKLFLAAEDNGTIRVIDLKSGKLERTVKGFNKPHSILYLPGADELYVTDGSKAVQVLDSKTFGVTRTIATTPGADSIGVDRFKDRLYAVTGGKDVSMSTSAISEIDTKSGKLIREIPINAAHVEAMVLEQGGSRLFVNVTDKNYLAVIDRAAGKMIAKWPIGEARENAPIAFDQAGRRLFVVCRNPGRLVVLDSSSGRTIASFSTGAEADEVVFDAVHHRIYVASGEGKIYAYQQVDPDHYTALPPAASAPGAKTALLAPDATRLYVSVSPGEGKTGARVLIYQVE
jgi:DNA-binding beta-propeller fold protein YncE